jgi:hypothetical protein
MARVTNALIASLARPSFGQGLFTAGQSLGGIPGDFRNARNAREMGLFVADQGTRDPGQSVEAILSEAARRGIDPKESMGQYQAKVTADQLSQTQEKQAHARGRMVENLIGMGVPDFIVDALRNDVLSPKETMEWFFNNQKTTKRGGTITFDTIRTIRDENDNEFLETAVRDPVTQKVSINHQPIGTTPRDAKPTGKFSVIDSNLGESGREKTSREVYQASETEAAKGFQQTVKTAREELPETLEREVLGMRMLNLLDEINTGGITPIIGKRIGEIFGSESENVASQAEFEKLAKQRMLANLKSFGSNPTEGERQAAMSLVETLTASETLNRRQLEAYLDLVRRKKEREKALLQPGQTREQYDTFLRDSDQRIQQQYERRVISFEELPD